ncbi:histidine kinase [Streptomyces sp. NPDC047123]|uniref:sensor histidine kinase n=1 Tax=Streptomyces sp. NPDC047123 TaxID=3155622 RepID=UPI0033FF80ED
MTTARTVWTGMPGMPGARYRWARGHDTLVRDGLLALLLTLTAFIPTLSTIGAQIGDLPERPAGASSVALTLAQTLPLVGRRHRPAACLAVIAGAFAVHQALGYATTFGSLGLYAALYSAGAHQAHHRRVLPAAASAGYAALAVLLHHLGSPQGAMDFLAFYLALAGFWLLGRAVRARRAHEAEHRRLVAEVATATERARIARELHDVVTHHVTAMVIQTDAAQFLIPGAPGRAAEALIAVSDTGRRALTELRSMLDVLEATGDGAAAPRGDERSPATGELAELVAQARRSGQPVEFTEHGASSPHPVDIELTAYRTVQEALTNAMKYAPGQPTSVSVRHTATQLEVTVITDGPQVPPAKALPGGGRGLSGLRARVQALHGELHAGPRPTGGFEVRATLPTRPGASL